MTAKKVHTKIELKAYRKKLRLNLTPAEAFLWKHLKSKQVDGKRFKKQHSIGKYIVDFYFASEKLIIESDGEVHNNPTALKYYAQRTVYLNKLGYTIIWFENKLVFDELHAVLEKIKSNFKFD